MAKKKKKKAPSRVHYLKDAAGNIIAGAERYNAEQQVKTRVLIFYRHALAYGTASLSAGFVEGYVRTLVSALNKLSDGAIKVIRLDGGALCFVSIKRSPGALSPLAIQIAVHFDKLPVDKKINLYHDTVNVINTILADANLHKPQEDLGI